ncbi:MAG TPA: homocitrate synthase [Candidatus Altiarchaeales archaeon]|nr:homocitrate synthase [Candidatus Altiarchaeales archaeon]
MAKKTIYLIDVTNRDGVQTSRIGLAKLEKTMINLYLDKMGVFQTEFGFPLTRHETNYLNANLELDEMNVFRNIRLSGWARAIKSDVEKSFELVPKIKYFNLSMSTSEQMLKYKFKGKYSWNQILSQMRESVKYALAHGAEAVGVNAEDASRTELERLIEFTNTAKQAGAERVRYCDTLGYDDPLTTYERIYEIARETQVPIEMHCHNDLGMAVGNSVAGAKAAVDAGVDAYINTTVNGIGERAGNADLVSTILAVEKSSGMEGNYRLDPKVKLKYAWKIAKYASQSFHIPIPVNQPAVGDNAFAHESGIHADGALKNSRNYELYHYTEVGRGHIEQLETGRNITAGEYSGIKGFKNIAGKYEIKFADEADAREILELVRYANVHTQKPITEDELKFIANYPAQARKIMTVVP